MKVIWRYDIVKLATATTILIGTAILCCAFPFVFYSSLDDFMRRVKGGPCLLLMMPFVAILFVGMALLMISGAIASRGAALVLKGRKLYFPGFWFISISPEAITSIEVTTSGMLVLRFGPRRKWRIGTFPLAGTPEELRETLLEALDGFRSGSH